MKKTLWSHSKFKKMVQSQRYNYSGWVDNLLFLNCPTFFFFVFVGTLESKDILIDWIKRRSILWLTCFGFNLTHVFTKSKSDIPFEHDGDETRIPFSDSTFQIPAPKLTHNKSPPERRIICCEGIFYRSKLTSCMTSLIIVKWGWWVIFSNAQQQLFMKNLFLVFVHR